jgi:site-specific DNA recombinase
LKARCWRGYDVFYRPVGYRYERLAGHGKVLVRNEPLASIVQEALEGYALGRYDTQAEVKRFLESQPEFPKDFPNGEIRNQRVIDLLNRVAYAGYIDVPNWDIPLRKGVHEGLVTLETHELETYERIEARLKGGAKVPARKDLCVDFPLRGFVVCADCGHPLTASWSKSATGASHACYWCHHRGCPSHRRSIRRDRIEGAFEERLRTLQPSRKLFDVTRAMFRKAWDIRGVQAEAVQAAAKAEVVALDRQIEKLVDRIVEAESPAAISAYEARIAKLEREKLVATERLTGTPGLRRPFDEMLELAMRFLASLWNLWLLERLDDRRTVLKPTFARRPAYDRETGARAPDFTWPFNQTLRGRSKR